MMRRIARIPLEQIAGGPQACPHPPEQPPQLPPELIEELEDEKRRERYGYKLIALLALAWLIGSVIWILATP